ncbi:gephyrin-like molybdotransferase Glp [Magnetospirillum aberrantis]|uniref:Molybdopterin molybdenumtransferase n=1 Tax=Magnetospirillum aberrantis SpK TaxID=908842 RepID=A0A7C9UXT1_9PROT|nr:gephyrin-like molybdotransferase Glp [Magnetospirillum aberrantis]NFV79114.1 molybdopterin molybdotransferase MoeA [Magnetospirillum aberrantis SpK]
MISVEVALERVLAGCRPSPAELVALPSALGRVVAEDVVARVAHPPLDVSAMDGYAVRAADTASIPAELTVVGQSAAGHPFTGEIGSGQAVRIFTGAPIPLGTDAVIMQEDTEREGDRVRLLESVSAGQSVRPRGMDFQPGQVGLTAGTILGPRQIALAAAMNVPWLPVRRRPRVAILSTGDEIAMPGDPLAAAQLPSCNGPALAALVTALGGEALQLGIAGDSRDSLSAMVAAANGCDLLVTSGGASVGDYDMVQDVLAEHGMKLDFWKIAMRPGKPLMFGTLKSVPVLGLPGNPVSAMVGAYVFLVPLLRALSGLVGGLSEIPVRLGRDVRANDARQDYLRADLTRDQDGVVVATPHERQDSAVVSGLATATAFVVRTPHAAAAKAGEMASALVLPDIF